MARSEHRVPDGLRSACCVLLLAVTATQSGGDIRLERTRTYRNLDSAGQVRSSGEARDVVFVGEGVARWDTDAWSVMVRTRTGVYLWLDHKAKAYAELSLPLELEDLLTDFEKDCVKSAPMALVDATAKVTWADEFRVIDGRKARRVTVEGVTSGGDAFSRDFWMTRDFAVDLEPYLEIVRNRSALNPMNRGWIEEFLSRGGFPAEGTSTVSVGGGQRIVEQRLISVDEVPAEAARYQPPAGYAPSLDRPPLGVACVTPENGL